MLSNRGIRNIEAYLKLSDEVIHSYELFSDTIHMAVERLLHHIENESLIQIIVDPDTDGYCSASMLYMYIKDVMKYNRIIYSLHHGKEHGITQDIVIHEDTKLLIVPDAGTNDVEQAKQLALRGIDVIVIDHHISDLDNPYALIVNNQCCDYPNKQLCGAGVVYKFLQALDDVTWNEGADNYLDLVAVANIGDIMDLREYETRRLVTKGLQRIAHPFIKALLEKRKFDVSDTDIPNVIDMSFYIVPLINAMIRSGTQEEKQLMFEAFIKDYKTFTYQPRRKNKNDPMPLPVEESIYEKVVRLSLNAKSRQNKAKEKSVKSIVESYSEYNKENIIFFANVTGLVEQEHTGLVAMEIAKKFNRPCLALRKNSTGDTYSGSGRNIKDGIIENLKEELMESGLFEMVAGHEGAFGCEIKKENIPKAIAYFNAKYQGYNFEPIYRVDFILEELTYQMIRELDKLKWVYSSFIEEPKIALENFEIGVDDIEVFGKAPKVHWKVNLDGIEYIKFNATEEDALLLQMDTCNSMVLNLVGVTKINQYGGKVTPQFLITDYEILEIQ